MTAAAPGGMARFLPPGGDAATARESGRDIRGPVPRSEHAEVVVPEHRDPLRIIERTRAGRIPELIGVRVNRMLQSAHAYYRGTVDVMTRDLAAGPRTGIHVVIDADAHLGNFGLYASPERRLVFDLNDFDEAGIGPWEWDLKRMGVSLVLELAEQGAGEERARRGEHRIGHRRRGLSGKLGTRGSGVHLTPTLP